MSCQTDIRGIEHKIMIRPDKHNSNPFEESTLSNKKTKSNANTVVYYEESSTGKKEKS